MAILPKPNQEKEKSKIESILREEFEMEAEIEISALQLPHSEEAPVYNQLTIIADVKYSNQFFNNSINGRFNEFGVEYIFYKSKN